MMLVLNPAQGSHTSSVNEPVYTKGQCLTVCSQLMDCRYPFFTRGLPTCGGSGGGSYGNTTNAPGHPRHWLHPHGSRDNFLTHFCTDEAADCLPRNSAAASQNTSKPSPILVRHRDGGTLLPGREVVAQRRAAEAAGPADPQHSEQQLAHNQRMQHLQQQLQDLQRSELTRKEQQHADSVAQQRAALLQWEQQLIERQHQLEQQQADLSRREQALTERQHQLQQQQADLDSREQQQARIQTLPQQFHSLQQELKAQQAISNNHPLPDPSPCSRAKLASPLQGHHIEAPALSDPTQPAPSSPSCLPPPPLHGGTATELPQWAMAGCACNTCMSVPCLPCMKPDTTTPLGPMPMFRDTVKEVRDDEECYALLMLFHPNLMYDEECFGKLTNTHCARYRMHMGWKREKERRELRRLVRRELQSEQLEFEYERTMDVAQCKQHRRPTKEGIAFLANRHVGTPHKEAIALVSSANGVLVGQ
ncbi:hypothetical protein HaLaN_21375 [Haematococcus lacustris]|uniref:Uncharacterized protein n=1 Tax=Haematococcus lacustris TaxID=44745 RepID=A0A699ZVS8_HAELA|nr:hypothetical protein HaLaN_21375 [Haematococcus lacustris]